VLLRPSLPVEEAADAISDSQKYGLKLFCCKNRNHLVLQLSKRNEMRRERLGECVWVVDLARGQRWGVSSNEPAGVLGSRLPAMSRHTV